MEQSWLDFNGYMAQVHRARLRLIRAERGGGRGREGLVERARERKHGSRACPSILFIDTRPPVLL